VLDVLKDSKIVLKTGKDDRSRFWVAYGRVAEERNDKFLERYYNAMDIVLIFVSFACSHLPCVGIDVQSVWSVLSCQHGLYRGHGVESQSRPQLHYECHSPPARLN